MKITKCHPAAPRRQTFARRVTASILTLAMVSACGDPRDAFNRDPELSDMSVTGSTMPEASFVQVPMPPPEPPRLMHGPRPRPFGSGGQVVSLPINAPPAWEIS